MKQFKFAKLSIQKILLIGGIVVLAFSCSTDMESAEKVLADAANAKGSSSSSNVSSSSIVNVSNNNNKYKCGSSYYDYRSQYCSDGVVHDHADSYTGQFCDYGYPTSNGGGCFPIETEKDCNTTWGRVASDCDSRTDLRFCRRTYNTHCYSTTASACDSGDMTLDLCPPDLL